MAERVRKTEANKSDPRAVELGKHSSRKARFCQPSPSLVLRKPLKYSAHDVEVLLESLWGMFTQTQARKLMVSIPWDDSDEPQQLTISALVEIMELWLDEPVGTTLQSA